MINEKQLKKHTQWLSDTQKAKICVGCGFNKSITSFDLIDEVRVDKCKSCHKIELDKTNNKLCTKCKIPKLKEGFMLDSRNSDGYGATCKDCRNKANKERTIQLKQTDPNYREKKLEYDRQYYRANKSKINKYKRNWRSTPEAKTKQSEYDKQRYLTKGDEIRVKNNFRKKVTLVQRGIQAVKELEELIANHPTILTT